MSLFLCLFDISQERYCQKSLVKSGVSRKNIKNGGGGRIYLFIYLFI